MERSALLEFKHGIKIDHCSLLASWGGTLDHCQWHGIQCDNHTGHVIMLHLAKVPTVDYSDDFCLEGRVSASLAELKHLQFLDLSYNNFQGQSIPKFIGSFPNLRHLKLSNSRFSGVIPHEIGNLSRLSSLDLNCLNDTTCSMRVESLSWLSSLNFLRDVNLGGVNFSHVSNWVSSINNLPSLEILRMDSCSLSMQLSSPLSYINASKTLHIISLSGNNFQGTEIFEWLYNLTQIATSLVYLDLSASQISGSIPSFIWKMSSVSYLDLSENGFSGQIPSDIGSMHNLSYLNLDFNHLSGPIPSEIWTIGRLSHVSLSLNRLGGYITATISNLKHLSFLDLTGNSVEISLPAFKALGKLCSLQTLRLDNNNLTYDFSKVVESFSPCASKSLVSLTLSNTKVWGSIPDSIKTFSSLVTLNVANNQLNGTINEGIGQLSKLNQLYLFSNYLNGIVSHNHFSNLSSLIVLDFSDNPDLVLNLSVNWTPPFQLLGLGLSYTKVGPHFPKWLQTQQNINDLELSMSGIHDTVPRSFWSSLPSTLEYLNMSYNMIYGEFPDLSVSFQSLIEIDLSSNNLSGAIPSFLGNSFTQLNLKNNQLSKGLFRFLCPTTEMGLIYLDLSNNLFSETIPDCWGYFSNLKILNLENNRITGNLPSSIASLSTLQALHLRNNNLHGELPKSWMNSTSLAVLDLGYNSLSGHIPASFVHGLKNLNILTLRNNQLSEGIPSSLCQLSCLQILDISGNQISGPLPNCLYNLKAMANTSNFTQACAYIYVRPNWLSGDIAWFMWKRKEHSFADSRGLLKGIDISNNNLQGRIPDDISSLVGLVFLNLSQNNLNSVIPSTIGQLTSLEFLDLSHNHLSGEIPTSLASINYLEILDLSMNNLSGRIPPGTQLQGFDASAYMGNPGLCGAPLLNCFGDEPNPAPQNGDNIVTHKVNDFILGLVISVVLGFITGFWGVCGTLVLKRSWRIALFRFYDNVRDKVYVTVVLNTRRVISIFREV
ncbi:receptor-like protein EIX2 [Silene latifolia]|uniref:receptor-like protein EIX2 n=1 Tax=Silene latifolia TaxID=37657 RepID=UPI003D77259A